MMKSIIYLLILFSIAFCKYSYSDKCYRFEDVGSAKEYDFYLQYYFNKKGLPMSNDEIISKVGTEESRPSIYSFYYHRVLSNCTYNDSTYRCTQTIESVWFRVDNKTSGSIYVEKCDPIFTKKYADVTKYHCQEGFNPFSFIISRIGEKSTVTIKMNGNEPATPSKYNKSDDKCIWEYEILGLIPLITVLIVACLFVVALIVIIVLVVFVQKNRSVKRQRLTSSLMNNQDKNSI